MEKISVIIPVFNSEKNLSACIDSIISQPFKEIEVLCADYGSTDLSNGIIKKYLIFDNRIKFIESNAQSIGEARNTSLKSAKGEYIAFVDPDDTISPKMFEILYENALTKESDIAYANSLWFNPLEGNYHLLQNGAPQDLQEKFKDGEFSEFAAEASLYFNLPFSFLGRLYKRSFLEANHISFVEGKIFEDIPFFTQSYICAKKISYLNDFLYFIRADKNPITDGRKLFDIFDIFEITQRLFIRYEKYEKYKTKFLLFQIKTLLTYLQKGTREFQEAFLSEIKARYSNYSLDGFDLKELEASNEFVAFVKLVQSQYTFNSQQEQLS